MLKGILKSRVKGESPGSSVVHGNAKDTGQARLEELGYKQELNRDLSIIANFGFSFAVISILTGVTTLYNTGLTYGGTISMVYGWLIAGFFNCFVALGMAEICSAFPTSGGLYYWSYALSGPKWGPFASWMTGWFNLIGQWAVTTSVDFSLAQLLQVIILLSTGGGNGGGYYASKYEVVGMHGGILLIHALINSLSIHWVAYLGVLAVFWNLFGVLVLMVLIPLVAVQNASTEFVFTSFNQETGAGIHSQPYIFLLGLLMAQYSISGYDASAHMSEETKSSDRTGAIGLVGSVVISIIVGWGYIVGITYAVVDPSYLLDPTNDANGYAIAQVFYGVFKDRYGHGVGGIICLCVVGGAVFLCGMSCVTSNSRMVYAFSRDGAMPLSRVWHMLDRREVPLPAVWLSAFVAFCMALTYLGSVVAFQAMVSIATIGLYISYALPILFRITVGHKNFVPGPFHLGKFSRLVGTVAVLWVTTITVLFCLPTVYPVTSQTLNYTPILVGGLFGLALGGWLLSARKWFVGPNSTLYEKPNASTPIYMDLEKPNASTSAFKDPE